MKLKIIFFIVINIIFNQNCYTQNKMMKDFGSLTFEVGGNYLFHTSDFIVYDKIVDCGIYNSGSGKSLNISLIYDKNIFKNTYFSIGVSYFKSQNELINERIFSSRDTINGGLIDIKTNTIIENNIDFINITPSFKYQLSKKFINGPLFFNIGSEIMIPIKNSYKQYERIISPSNSVFIVNGARTQTRDLANGTISTFNIPLILVDLSLENLLKIGEDKWFTQKIGLDYTLNNYLSNVSKWKSIGIHLSLGIRFDLKSEKDTLKEIKKEEKVIIPQISENATNLITQQKKQDVILKKEEIPFVEKVKSVDKLNDDIIKDDIRINATPIFDLNYIDFNGEIESGNEYIATLPIVNAVFFEKNSSEIPAKYILKSHYFEKIKNPIEFHKYIIPVISKILIENPTAVVELEGATSGSKVEQNSLSLAKLRAENVKRALIDNGIEKKRISIIYLEYPSNSSNQEYEGGIEENQRVTIHLKNAHLLEYISLQKFSNLVGNLGLNLKIENLGKNILNLKNSFPSINQKINNSQKINLNFNHNIKEDIILKNTSKDNKLIISSSLILNDSLEKNYNYELNLSNLKNKYIESSFENFKAILRFDYNSSKLNNDNKSLIKELLEIIPDGMSIEIYGSADELGTEKRNQILSKERADVTKEFIKKESKKKIIINSLINENKFDETTPEGRFLNRSILIKIKKIN